MTDAKDGTSEFFSSMLVLGSLSEQLKLELQRSTLEIYQRERQREMQKQPSRRVLKKRCPENMKQIYRRTTMSKCDLQENTNFGIGVLP